MKIIQEQPDMSSLRKRLEDYMREKGAAIVAGGLGLLGVIVPASYWRALVGFGAALSLVVILVYAHPFYLVGTAASVAILVVLLWLQWPSPQVLGS